MKYGTLNGAKAEDLFSDVTEKAELSVRQDEFDSAMAKSFKSATNGFDAPTQNPVDVIEALKLDKSISAETLAGLEIALTAQQNVNKEMTLASPLSTGFAAFDLEAPAKLIFPKMTPLVNRIARKKGVGTAHRTKVVTGITGSDTGGNANIHPGLVEATTNTYGGLSLQRGKQITQTAEDQTFDYSSFALGNSVSFDAQDSAMGFDDLRSMAVQNTIYAMKLMEEKMALYGRGTLTGYRGALAAPTFTLTSPVASGSETALAATTYYVYVTADAGSFGESIASTVASTAVAGGDVLLITIDTIPTGAVAANIYVGTTTGLANCTYQGRTTGGTFVVQGAASTQRYNTAPYTTTGAAATRATADTSAYVAGYDGIIPVVLSGSNVVNANGAVLSTSNAGVEFQDAFSLMWDAVKANPDAIFMNGADRNQLSNAIKIGGSTNNYRMEITPADIGGFTGGLVMTGLINGITGKTVDIEVNPWLEQGVAPILSWTLPMPDTNVSDVWAFVNVQDYRGTQWPVIQRTYDNEVSLRGLFMCYANAWNGAVKGIKAA